ncbi:MAG: hypothetical protein AABW80_03035 [Nanoarchaeota archaeon]
MGCNCKVTEAVIAIVIIVFALWSGLSWAKWIVVIAAVLLLIHSCACKSCATSMNGMASSKKKRK